MKQIEFRHKDDRYAELVNQFCAKRHLLSNYYGIDNDDVDYYATESTLVIKANEEGFSRIYVMSDNEQETIEILNTLPKNCAINIPSRNGIEEWKRVLENADFNRIATYHRYHYSNFKKGNINGLMFATEKDIIEIFKNIRFFFSPITGHLPDEIKLMEMIKKNQILIHKNSAGKLQGALGCVTMGNKADFPFWFDNVGGGLSLLYNAFAWCHLNNVRNIVFWVNDVNEDTIHLHKLLGASADGMTDYIYIN